MILTHGAGSHAKRDARQNLLMDTTNLKTLVISPNASNVSRHFHRNSLMIYTKPKKDKNIVFRLQSDASVQNSLREPEAPQQKHSLGFPNFIHHGII